MRYTDQELDDIKARAIAALATGSHLARSAEYVIELIKEVQESRRRVSVAPGPPPTTAEEPESEAPVEAKKTRRKKA